MLGSKMFIGSEESIIEIEADSRTTGNPRNDGVNTGLNSSVNNPTQSTREQALTHLIRSREFVIDFPRIFVLDAGSSSNSSTLSLARVPERSQSSLSLAHTKDWMSLMNNKLEEQQGQPRMRKLSSRFQMQENLLGIRSESIRKRRSRSADGRYSNGFFGRKELTKQQILQNEVPSSSTMASEKAGKADILTVDLAVLRRNSDAIYELTEASYAESKQKRLSMKRDTDVELKDIDNMKTMKERKTEGESNPPADVHITIQINGEGVKLEE